MAILSGKKARNGPSSGHEFDRINEKIYGSMRNKINRMREVYNNDYLCVYKESDSEDDFIDVDIGINKNHHRIHDLDWCNDGKNEYYQMDRYFEKLALDDEFTDVSDFFYEDGSLNMEKLSNLLDEEGNYDE